MQTEQWQTIERLFGEAVRLPPVGRARFLADECGSDLELREELSSMLAEDADEEFLSESVFGIGARLLDAEDLLREPEFGAYQLQKLLGRGGMGAVYLARDTRLERLVALKVLPAPVIENESEIARFRQEARAASGISHPNVAHIYEFGTTDNRWFLAMEYVAGQTLRDVLKEKSLAETEVLTVIRQIADALAATHRRGIVHRDIKPENIIVGDDGTVKVLDFGLAKPNSTSANGADESAISAEDSPEIIFGTVAYMSPEQIRGETADARTDLWSLGVVLFELLTGKRPFGGDSTEDLRTAILNQAVPIDDCPPKFRRVVEKLLQKNPADRYQSAAELSADLRLPNEKSENIADLIREHKIIVAVLLIGLLALAATGFRVFNYYAPVLLAPAPPNSIAVLPFVGDSEEEDYLSDGLTEALINKLSRLSKLSVKPKSATFRYKGKTVDPQTVGRELSVQFILLGHINEKNDSINLDLDLMDAQTGNRIWNRHYNRKNTELIVLQNEIGRDVSANLQPFLSDAEEKVLGKNYTENPEAFRLYLRGRFHWNKRTAKDISKSIEYYDQAVALDPNFALAFAGLADSYLLVSGYAVGSPHESFPKAKAMALKALEIDDTLAEAHNALSYELFNYEWNVVEAEKELKIAIKLNPNYVTTHQWYATSILVATGRFDEAISEAKRAQMIDPLSLSVNTDIGSVYLFARRDDDAVEQLKKTVEMDDNFGAAHAYLCRAYLMKKDFSTAAAECRKSQTLYNDPRPTTYLARVYADQGERQKALKIVEQLKINAQQKYVSNYYFAIIYAGLGDNDLAFEHLERAFQDREGRMTLLRVDPLMDKLRADSRFENLARRVRAAN